MLVVRKSFYMFVPNGNAIVLAIIFNIDGMNIEENVVHYDTDATDCVRKGWYQRVSDANNGN